MLDFIFKKFGNKLIAIIIFIVLVPLVVSAYLASVQVQDVLHTSLKKRVLNSSQAADKLLGNLITEKLTYLRLFSGEEKLQQCALDNCVMDQLLNAYLETAALDLIFVNQPNGKLFSSAGLADGLIENMQHVISSKQIISGAEVSGIIKYNGELAIVAIVPVITAQGKVLGIMGAAKVLDNQIALWIKHTTGAETGFFVNGDLVASTLRGRKGWRINKIPSSISTLKELREQRINSVEKRIDLVDYELEARFSLIRDVDNNPVGMLLVGVSQMPSVVALEKIRMNIALVAIFAILSAVFIAVFFAKRVTVPVQEIVDVANIISKGDFSKRAKIITKDEIGQLAAAFNEMTNSLQNTTVSKDYMDSIVSKMAECLVVFNLQGKIETINDSTVNLSGYGKSELEGSSINDLLKLPGSNQLSFEQEHLRKILKYNVVRDLDVYIACKSGAYIPVNFSASIMLDKQGKATSIVGVARDMREIRNMQAMLVQSEKLSAIGQLGAGVAHELNNPLAGILSLVRTYLKKKEPGTREHELLQDMEEASEHMAKIIKDLGDFSKQSTGDFIPLNCNEIIEAALSFSAFQLKKKGIKLEKQFAENLAEIKGDKSQLQQVVVNFLTNARDAMDQGGIFKIVTKNAEKNGKKYVELEFSDTGCGIEPENIEKIFDPFYTTKRPGGGTGLGLSITHTIVSNHQGFIRVKSEPDVGSIFTVSLPAIT
ncbi:MAG: ATP-binding protein [Pseudomonadota bacterium]